MALGNATKANDLKAVFRRVLQAGLVTLGLACFVTPALAESCGLLWRVEPEGIAPSHVFGTIHSEDARVVDLPEPVAEAFRSSDVYAMEMIPDFEAMSALTRAMHFQDQRNLKDVLDDELYREVTKALSKRGVGEGLALKMKPWAVMVTLSFPQPETGIFLDMMLFNRAMAGGKETVGLEDAEEQLAFFTGLSREEQITLLEATLDHQDEIDDTMERLVEAWLSRDPLALSRLSDTYLDELPDGLARRFREQAIDERNHRMIERAQPLVADGNAFIAVGALHLYGEEGLLELLQRHGYTVTCVY
jgi:uncharacterized protein YbaP (TraB family)